MKKIRNKQAIKASKAAKAENMKKNVITVKNAEGEPNTQAEILIQNKIDYEPKVSVIIPVYNVEDYLRECLDSVCGQTLKEIEIICVDDGSTDGSLEILKEYAAKDCRMTVMKQENSGSGKSRNNGINSAKGEFVAFMDSDDFYPSNKTLEKMYNTAHRHNVNICGGSLNQLKDGKILTDAKLFEDGYTFEREGIIDYKDYQFDYGYWRFIYKQKFLVENQLYFPDYLRQQDPPFFIKAMAVSERFYALTEATYVYRVSHKKVSWTERKVLDMFKGLEDSFRYSKEFGLENLHIKQVQRINSWTFRTALAEMIKYDSVRQQVRQAFLTIDKHILSKQNIVVEFDPIYEACIEQPDIVSVIVPVYNVEKYLPRCLDSILAQTLKNIEIICVNDGSTDGSFQILNQYATKDKRIHIINKKNGGLSSARNVGIENAHCPYIYFIDSDDWIAFETLEKAVAKMTGIIDFVSFGANIINEGIKEDDNGLVISRQYHKIKIAGQKNVSEDIIKRSTYTVWNKLFKKDIINQYNIKFAEGRLFEDNDFTIMYMMHSRCGYFLDEYLYNYSQRSGSIMERVRAKQCDKTADNLYIFDNLYQHCKKYNLLDKYKGVLAVRYSIHLKSAYKFAPYKMKENIKQVARQLAVSYQKDIFWNHVIENLIDENYSLVHEFDEIIISLTSYPARIHTVNQTIESLLNQTMKADKVILWLAPEQFPNKEEDLPQQLLDLREKGLTIDWYHDIKSYKKLIPTLKKYPNAVIITADDDILYDKNWCKILYESYIQNPQLIWAHRVHQIALENFKIAPYKKWQQCVKNVYPSFYNFCTTGGGVLYPPNCFSDTVFDEEKFMKLCPNADDIWFWGQLVLNKYKIGVVENNINKISIIDATQETALWYDNVLNGQNDIQLKALLKEYPQILKILRSEKKYSLMYLLFPYNLLRHIVLKKKYAKMQYLRVKHSLLASRIDIKNCGTADNAIEIRTKSNVSTPAWFANVQGIGKIVSSNTQRQVLDIKAIKSGKLSLSFKGQDKRCNNTRLKLWTDYQSIKIDGKEILSKPISVWHDAPFNYQMPVKDGQVVKLEVVQQYHTYSMAELKDIISKLNSGSEYVAKRINRLTRKIYKKIAHKSLLHEIKDRFSFARKIAPVMDLMQQNQAQTLKLLQEIQAQNLRLEKSNNELKKEVEMLKGALGVQLAELTHHRRNNGRFNNRVKWCAKNIFTK